MISTTHFANLGWGLSLIQGHLSWRIVTCVAPVSSNSRNTLCAMLRTAGDVSQLFTCSWITCRVV